MTIACPVSPPAAAPDAAAIYLHPGHSFVADAATQVTTILGSCVAVCIWDEVAGVGGLTHYLLPQPLGKDIARPRFGATAIVDLIDVLIARGARPARVRAKLFGGSTMNAALASTGNDVGSKNVELAVEVLSQRSIAIVARDTGGSLGRKLLFHTHDGHAWVKYLGVR